MKKIIKLILIFEILFNTFSLNKLIVKADTYTATVTDQTGINVRASAGTGGTKLGALNYKAQINLNSLTKYTGTGCNGWYQVTYNSKIGYICSELVSVKTTSTTASTTTVDNSYYTVSTWTSRINEDYAIVRTSPNGSVIENIYLGTDVNVLEKTSNTTNCQESWYKIEYYNNKIGYVCGRLVDEYENITAYDAEYNKVLQNAGFPESYWPYLTYLHQKHPNWTFIAEKTNLNFNDVINNETGKNYIQYSAQEKIIPSYVTSNTARESGTWYTASKAIVAYLMDTRNYLNEKNIFVFEKLSYNSATQTRDILKTIFSGTYLENDMYINYFMNAANQYQISPIHLATRIKKEGGTNETYDGVSGTSTLTYGDKSLYGFYNYYNIGAFQDSVTSSSVGRGLAVAAGYISYGIEGAPWDTREKAIMYGAKWIASNYINKGQDTLYYQKFNTGPNSHYTKYTHQYMTNIIAPASEALTAYNSYKKLDLLNIAYTFTIPVYENTPGQYTSHPITGDTNNNLSEIKINNNTINGFDKDVITYDYYVSSNTTSINLAATPEKSTSTVTGTGTISLPNQTTTVQLVVTNQVKTSKTYTINIIKTNNESTKIYNPDEIINKIDVKISNNFITGININTTINQIANQINQLEPNAQIKIIDKNGNTKNTTVATGDKLIITSNNETKTYTFSIKGDVSGDGKITILDLLKVQKAILGKETLINEYKDASDINYDNKTTILDLLKVQKAILGKETFK